MFAVSTTIAVFQEYNNELTVDSILWTDNKGQFETILICCISIIDLSQYSMSLWNNKMLPILDT